MGERGGGGEWGRGGAGGGGGVGGGGGWGGGVGRGAEDLFRTCVLNMMTLINLLSL